jgi:hypothetical protein
MFLIKGHLEEKFMGIVNKRHQIKFIKKSQNML